MTFSVASNEGTKFHLETPYRVIAMAKLKFTKLISKIEIKYAVTLQYPSLEATKSFINSSANLSKWLNVFSVVL